tara:strand:- start:7539 stop:7847 length:309 start_codon:yes stop_codon:yes gene_type:complete
MSELDTLEEEQLWIKSMRVVGTNGGRYTDGFIELLETVGFDLDDLKEEVRLMLNQQAGSALIKWLDARLDYNAERLTRLRKDHWLNAQEETKMRLRDPKRFE